MIAARETPTGLIPHKNREGQVIGVKKAKEGFLRYEIWQAPDKDKKGGPIYQGRLIPPPAQPCRADQARLLLSACFPWRNLFGMLKSSFPPVWKTPAGLRN